MPGGVALTFEVRVTFSAIFAEDVVQRSAGFLGAVVNGNVLQQTLSQNAHAGKKAEGAEGNLKYTYVA